MKKKAKLSSKVVTKEPTLSIQNGVRPPSAAWVVNNHGSFVFIPKTQCSPSKYPKLHGFINGDDPNLRTAETNWDDPPTTMGGDSAIVTFF